MSKNANKNVASYRKRLIDINKQAYLDKLINHYQTPGSPCPTGTDEEIENVTRKFEWYQKDVCCEKMVQQDSEPDSRDTCPKCYTQISVNGSCNCY